MCLIVVPLPPEKTPFAVQLYNNNLSIPLSVSARKIDQLPLNEPTQYISTPEYAIKWAQAYNFTY
jgi:hypothetical protein